MHKGRNLHTKMSRRYILDFPKNFFRIGGNMAYPPPIYAHLQTDGSFFKKNRGFIGFHLTTYDNTLITKKCALDNVNSSTDAEWESIVKGLKFSLENNQEVVLIENDCLSVISHFSPHTLIHPKPAAKKFMKEIKDIAENMVYVGIRWVPREYNKADQILR